MAVEPSRRGYLPTLSEKELVEKTTKEIAQAYGLTPDQVHQMRQRKGIRMAKDTLTRAYAQRDNRFPQRNGNESAAIQLLESAGYRVSRALPHQAVVRVPGKPGQRFKLAVVCCTHLGNVAQQLTHLHDFYSYAQAAGYEEFWHIGDATDGPDSMHRDAMHEHFLHSFDRVVDYFAEAYPKVKSGRTHMILGNHDESWLKDPSGSDIGRAIAARRPDIVYEGRRAADLHLGPLRVYMMHGAGASSYARSYKLQKIVEGFPPVKRPHVLLAGNWHVPAHIPNYIGCEAYMVPSFEASTPFITSLGKESVIGGLLIEVELGQQGLRDIKTQWRLYDVALKGDHPH